MNNLPGNPLGNVLEKYSMGIVILTQESRVYDPLAYNKIQEIIRNVILIQ